MFCSHRYSFPANRAPVTGTYSISFQGVKDAKITVTLDGAAGATTTFTAAAGAVVGLAFVPASITIVYALPAGTPAGNFAAAFSMALTSSQVGGLLHVFV